MEKPKHLIDRALSTEDEGLQELRDYQARHKSVADPTVVSDSTIARLREIEGARARDEERRHWRWLGLAARNLLLWVTAVGSFLLVAADAWDRFFGRR